MTFWMRGNKQLFKKFNEITMKVSYKKSFNKSFEKLDIKIQIKTDEALSIFRKNPLDKSLRNHALFWIYRWFRSIDITWDFRAIFKEYPNWTYEFVDFIVVWSHSQLYG